MDESNEVEPLCWADHFDDLEPDLTEWTDDDLDPGELSDLDVDSLRDEFPTVEEGFVALAQRVSSAALSLRFHNLKPDRTRAGHEAIGAAVSEFARYVGEELSGEKVHKSGTPLCQLALQLEFIGDQLAALPMDHGTPLAIRHTVAQISVDIAAVVEGHMPSVDTMNEFYRRIRTVRAWAQLFGCEKLASRLAQIGEYVARLTSQLFRRARVVVESQPAPEAVPPRAKAPPGRLVTAHPCCAQAPPRPVHLRAENPPRIETGSYLAA